MNEPYPADDPAGDRRTAPPADIDEATDEELSAAIAGIELDNEPPSGVGPTAAGSGSGDETLELGTDEPSRSDADDADRPVPEPASDTEVAERLGATADAAGSTGGLRGLIARLF